VPQFRDAQGVLWSVNRQWWPFGDWSSFASADDVVGVIVLCAMLPFVVIWPFWLLLKLSGVSAWRVTVRRNLIQVDRERVAGWRASGERVNAIMAALKAGVFLPDVDPDAV
jgi:hypothetical protein